MAGLLARVQQARKSWTEAPFWALDSARWQAVQSQWPVYGGTSGPKNESIGVDYLTYVREVFKSSPVVFAAIDKRVQVFSQASFAFQRRSNGRGAAPFTTADLSLLEKPWPGGTTGELLSLMEYDGSIAGSAYWTICDDHGNIGNRARGSSTARLVRLRPDWVTLVINSPSGDPWALDAKLLAYSYLPKVGTVAGAPPREPLVLLPEEVARYTPKPDPIARFRGISWITPLIQDVMGDQAATLHKLKFFQNGANPTMAVKFDRELEPELFDEFVAKFNDAHGGVGNAYKTLFLGGGADVTPLTVDLRQLDFAVTQGAGETRLAVVSGVPAAILGIGSGLGGSSLNDGNLRATKRVFVQSTIQDLWNKVGPSLENLINVPGNARLVVDTRDIPFLQDDATDQAAVRQLDAAAILSLVNTGFDPDAAVAFCQTNDLSSLAGQHSGLVSVQLRPPGSAEPEPAPGAVEANGQREATPGGSPASSGSGSGK